MNKIFCVRVCYVHIGGKALRKLITMHMRNHSLIKLCIKARITFVCVRNVRVHLLLFRLHFIYIIIPRMVLTVLLKREYAFLDLIDSDT